MARVRINYLKSNGLYSNGQSLVSKEDAMMPTERVQYYMKGAKQRGLSFDFEVQVIEVPDDEAENYADWGYEVL